MHAPHYLGCSELQ